MAEVRADVDRQIRTRYLARGPFGRVTLDALYRSGDLRRGFPDHDVEDRISLAVRSVIFEGVVLDRYTLTEDGKAWATAQYGWEILTGGGLAPLERIRRWGDPQWRGAGIARWMLVEVLPDHVRQMARYALDAHPERAGDLVALALIGATRRLDDPIDTGRAILEGLPAEEVVRFILGREPSRPGSHNDPVELAGVTLAVLGQAVAPLPAETGSRR